MCEKQNNIKEIRAMAHSTTILNQIASFFPRHDFEKHAQRNHRGQKFRSFNRWSQFLAMTIAQLTSRKSLRDLIGNIGVQKKRLYHLGMKPTSRATLARVNEQQPYETYQETFFQLLKKCQTHAPRHNFRFKGKVYLLDATTVNLCLSVFPWAQYRKAKGAIKLHFGLDADGHLPVFMNMTEGKKHEIEWARSLTLPSGSCVVFDRGFTDYRWYNALDKRKVTFVTRLKSNAKAYTYGNRRKPDSPDVIEDQKVKLRGYQFTFSPDHLCRSGNTNYLSVSDQLQQTPRIRGRSPLQATVENRAVLQMDQTKSQSEDFPWNHGKCSVDAAMDCSLCLPDVGLFQIYGKVPGLII